VLTTSALIFKSEIYPLCAIILMVCVSSEGKYNCYNFILSAVHIYNGNLGTWYYFVAILFHTVTYLTISMIHLSRRLNNLGI